MVSQAFAESSLHLRLFPGAANVWNEFAESAPADLEGNLKPGYGVRECETIVRVVKREIDDKCLRFDVSFADKAPETAVLGVVAVVAHHVECILFYHVVLCGFSIDKHGVGNVVLWNGLGGICG